LIVHCKDAGCAPVVFTEILRFTVEPGLPAPVARVTATCPEALKRKPEIKRSKRILGIL